MHRCSCLPSALHNVRLVCVYRVHQDVRWWHKEPFALDYDPCRARRPAVPAADGDAVVLQLSMPSGLRCVGLGRVGFVHCHLWRGHQGACPHCDDRRRTWRRCMPYAGQHSWLQRHMLSSPLLADAVGHVEHLLVHLWRRQPDSYPQHGGDEHVWGHIMQCHKPGAGLLHRALPSGLHRRPVGLVAAMLAQLWLRFAGTHAPG